MPRLRWLSSARRDVLDILDYVARESGSRDIGERVVSRLRARCRELAKMPVTLGVSRSELKANVRSVPFGRYVIFFRYEGNTLEIVNVVEGHRNLDAFFRRQASDDQSDA